MSKYLSALAGQYRQLKALSNPQRLEVLRALGSPQDLLRVIHVGGTNGKGSVCHGIASALLKTGKGSSVGLFTSPHIASARERIRINEVPISEESYLNCFEKVTATASSLNLLESTSFFDLYYMVALLYFVERRCDWVVLEVGLGGRDDATNTVSKPVCAVVTSIGWDHESRLGSTLEEIALHKAGIFKEGCPAVIGAGSEPGNVLLREANRIKSTPIVQVNQFEDYSSNNLLLIKTIYKIVINEELSSDSLISVPRFRGQLLSHEECNEVYKKVNYKKRPKGIIMDVCHNVTACEAAGRRLGRLNEKIVVGMSLSAPRGLSCMVALAKGLQDKLVCIEYLGNPHFRIRPVSSLSNEAGSVDLSNLPGLAESLKRPDDYSYDKAITDLYTLAADKDGILVICGTFFVMQAASHALGLSVEPEDPIELNEKGKIDSIVPLTLKDHFTCVVEEIMSRKNHVLTNSDRKSLLEKWGSPQDAIPCVHIGGTNGKGSVCTAVSRALQNDGFKVGLFMSPSIFDVRERIQINQELISKEDFIRAYQATLSLAGDAPVSFFDCYYLMALHYFIKEKCDYIVLEVGLGGTLDATNLVSKPVCSAIVSIGWDHQEILGNTLEKIALDKAGIFKFGAPAVIGGDDTCRSLLKREAEKRGATPVIFAEYSDNFLLANDSVANEIVQVILKRCLTWSELPSNGCKPRCRAEFIEKEKILNLYDRFGIKKEPVRILCDVAHNESALIALAKYISMTCSEKDIVLAVGLSRPIKCLLAFIMELSRLNKRILATFYMPNAPSAAPDQNSLDSQVTMFVETDLTTLINKALQLAEKNTLVVFTGSHYIMPGVFNIIK